MAADASAASSLGASISFPAIKVHRGSLIFVPNCQGSTRKPDTKNATWEVRYLCVCSLLMSLGHAPSLPGLPLRCMDLSSACLASLSSFHGIAIRRLCFAACWPFSMKFEAWTQIWPHMPCRLNGHRKRFSPLPFPLPHPSPLPPLSPSLSLSLTSLAIAKPQGHAAIAQEFLCELPQLQSGRL